MNRQWKLATVVAIVATGLLLSGCGQPVNWPRQPLFAYYDEAGQNGNIGFDLDRDGRADYIQQVEGGLKTRFRIDADGDGRFEVEFGRNDFPPEQCRTLVVLLDGIDHQTIDALWAEGYFRLFYRPAPLVSSFPSVTDTGWADVFNCDRPRGIEAVYFDRITEKLGGGYNYYLAGGQEAGWAWILSYRAHSFHDGLV
ncbi:MAG: hypothetical protein QF662_01465, partial [Phycisphaerae bacterium]|nr:hypothetical protein [Phycisphaerae bacterium]